MLLAGYLGRRTLLHNAFHRRLWRAVVVSVVTKLGFALTAYALHVTPLAFFALDVMAMAGMAAIFMYAGSSAKQGRWMPVALALLSAAATVYGERALSFLLLSYPLAGLLVAHIWTAEASRAQRERLHGEG